jgi:hypothetical protein
LYLKNIPSSPADRLWSAKVPYRPSLCCKKPQKAKAILGFSALPGHKNESFWFPSPFSRHTLDTGLIFLQAQDNIRVTNTGLSPRALLFPKGKASSQALPH